MCLYANVSQIFSVEEIVQINLHGQSWSHFNGINAFPDRYQTNIPLREHIDNIRALNKISAQTREIVHNDTPDLIQYMQKHLPSWTVEVSSCVSKVTVNFIEVQIRFGSDKVSNKFNLIMQRVFILRTGF